MARVALLACDGGLAFVVCGFGPFLLQLLIAYAFLTIASLCNPIIGPTGTSEETQKIEHRCPGFDLLGPIGIVLSARHNHSTPAGTSTSTKRTHSFNHRHIHALHNALPNTTGKHTHKVFWLDACTAAWLGGGCLRLEQHCWPA